VGGRGRRTCSLLLPQQADDRGRQKPRTKIGIPVNSKQIWKYRGILEIRFVASHVDEKVIEVDTGLSLEHVGNLAQRYMDERAKDDI
jgi:hypothetical protein